MERDEWLGLAMRAVEVLVPVFGKVDAVTYCAIPESAEVAICWDDDFLGVNARTLSLGIAQTVTAEMAKDYGDSLRSTLVARGLMAVPKEE
jgi:hypothetical protein